MFLNSLKFIYSLCFFALISALIQCTNDAKQSTENKLSVRLSREPDILNPVLSETSISATVQNLLFLSILDFDPYTQAAVPVLSESLAEHLKNGKSIGYKIKLRKDAVWDDGSPILATDVLFTIKAIANPFVSSGSKKSVIESIDSIELTADPKELIFWTDDNYFLDEQSYTNNYILQEKKYDSLFLLKNIPFTTLRSIAITDTNTLAAQNAKRFAALFSSPYFSREGALGAGPYKIKNWITNQSLTLEKKKNWWGDKYQSQITNFNAYPDEIIFRFIPEESNAILGMKEGILDFIPEISPAQFKNMKEDSALQHKVQFLQGAPIRYVYFALNTKSPLLQNVYTRKALAHLVDLDQLKSSLFQGYANRLNAPFLPSKAYYHQELEDIPFNIAMAQSLLAQAGWADSNKDGILDQNKQSLKLRLFTTPGGMGQRIAQHLAENAKQAGVFIDIVPKTLPLILEHTHKHDFEIAALAELQYNGPDDPYASWHSASYTQEGQNITGFGSPASDSIIQQIRISEPGSARIGLYKELQKMIYDQQPVLFLFAPQNLMAVNNRWTCKPATVRPGYFVNDFKLKSGF